MFYKSPFASIDKTNIQGSLVIYYIPCRCFCILQHIFFFSIKLITTEIIKRIYIKQTAHTESQHPSRVNISFIYG